MTKSHNLNYFIDLIEFNSLNLRTNNPVLEPLATVIFCSNWQSKNMYTVRHCDKENYVNRHCCFQSHKVNLYPYLQTILYLTILIMKPYQTISILSMITMTTWINMITMITIINMITMIIMKLTLSQQQKLQVFLQPILPVLELPEYSKTFWVLEQQQ